MESVWPVFICLLLAATEFADWLVVTLLLHGIHWGQRALFHKVGKRQQWTDEDSGQASRPWWGSSHQLPPTSHSSSRRTLTMSIICVVGRSVGSLVNSLQFQTWLILWPVTAATEFIGLLIADLVL